MNFPKKILKKQEQKLILQVMAPNFRRSYMNHINPLEECKNKVKPVTVCFQ